MFNSPVVQETVTHVEDKDFLIVEIPLSICSSPALSKTYKGLLIQFS